MRRRGAQSCALALAGVCLWFAAAPSKGQQTMTLPIIGKIIRDDPGLDRLIAQGASIEVLGSGFAWTEGPLWIKEGGFLLFSDIPRNSIMKWKEGEGVTLFMNPPATLESSTTGVSQAAMA